jgi:hypothetical protein
MHEIHISSAQECSKVRKDEKWNETPVKFLDELLFLRVVFVDHFESTVIVLAEIDEFNELEVLVLFLPRVQLDVLNSVN